MDSINSSEGALGRSLAPLYRNTDNQVRDWLESCCGGKTEGRKSKGRLVDDPTSPLQVAFLLYNDQPPKAAEINVRSPGHAKGEASADGTGLPWDSLNVYPANLSPG